MSLQSELQQARPAVFLPASEACELHGCQLLLHEKLGKKQKKKKAQQFDRKRFLQRPSFLFLVCFFFFN